MKKFLYYFIFFLIINVFAFEFLFDNYQTCSALEINNEQVYKVYDENGEMISERFLVEVGDIIITSDYDEYEIVSVDENLYTAKCKYNGYYIPPKIINNDNGVRLSSPIKKSVGLYMTHNDESYVPTDSYSSVYGKGGIHDVSKQLKQEFEDLGYDVYLDETLHLPHNSSAYSRSNATAQNLLKNNVDALFDIHRDGVSRSVYVKTIDGVERCKVRIVVGQANPNKEANLQFAMYLVDVAKEYCPWLFLDIYYAKGHYNQALTSKGLLFEMGTYLAEKDLVLTSTKYLAEVVDKTLFSTVVEDETTLTIKNEEEAVQDEKVISTILTNIDEENKEKEENSSQKVKIILFTAVFLIGSCFIIIKIRKKKKI